MRTLLNSRLTLKMERMARNYFSSKTWQYKKHNKKSPCIPIISFCLENETNGSMQSFLSTQHTLSKRRWGFTWEQWQSSDSHWVLPGHCPQHLPQQLGKLGRWSTASPPSQLLSQPPHVTSPGSPQTVEWTYPNHHTLWEEAVSCQGWNRSFCLWV